MNSLLNLKNLIPNEKNKDSRKKTTKIIIISFVKSLIISKKIKKLTYHLVRIKIIQKISLIFTLLLKKHTLLVF